MHRRILGPRKHFFKMDSLLPTCCSSTALGRDQGHFSMGCFVKEFFFSLSSGREKHDTENSFDLCSNTIKKNHHLLRTIMIRPRDKHQKHSRFSKRFANYLDIKS